MPALSTVTAGDRDRDGQAQLEVVSAAPGPAPGKLEPQWHLNLSLARARGSDPGTGRVTEHRLPSQEPPLLASGDSDAAAACSDGRAV